MYLLSRGRRKFFQHPIFHEKLGCVFVPVGADLFSGFGNLDDFDRGIHFFLPRAGTDEQYRRRANSNDFEDSSRDGFDVRTNGRDGIALYQLDESAGDKIVELNHELRPFQVNQNAEQREQKHSHHCHFLLGGLGERHQHRAKNAAQGCDKKL